MLELLATDKQLTNLIVIFGYLFRNKMNFDENSWIFDELNFQKEDIIRCESSACLQCAQLWMRQEDGIHCQKPQP